MEKDLRYPIGKANMPHEVTEELRQAWIQDIEELPRRLRTAVQGLTDEQLSTPYRHGGWTVCQVVHHVADSHLNSYVRFRLALTEEVPVIKPYDEGRWAELPDASVTRLEPSFHILEGVHDRWVTLLRSLNEEQFAKTFIHPASGETVSLEENLYLYSWHSRHHTAHITSLRERMSW